MKMSLLIRFRSRLLQRRNDAQRKYSALSPDPMNNHRTRLYQEVIVLDDVLDGLDRVVKNNQDRWHDRRKQ